MENCMIDPPAEDYCPTCGGWNRCTCEEDEAREHLRLSAICDECGNACHGTCVSEPAPLVFAEAS